jgi:hypothetical protein
LLGQLGWGWIPELITPTAMIVAQAIIAFPINYTNEAEVHNVTAEYITHAVHGAAGEDLREHSEMGIFRWRICPSQSARPFARFWRGFWKARRVRLPYPFNKVIKTKGFYERAMASVRRSGVSFSMA